MTAEVAVYNCSAIALAADSAAYVDGTSSGKIFNNAEKLFSLSKNNPIGIMIYGDSHISDIPWELIIKQYRKSSFNKTYDTLKEYVDNFFIFTEQFFQGLIDSGELHKINLYSPIKDSCLNTLKIISDLSSVSELSNPTDNLLIDNIIQSSDNLITAVNTIEYYENFSEEDKPSLKVLITSLLKNLYNFDESIKSFNAIVDACCEQIIRPDPFSDFPTGIVFAGYGEKEYFPRIITTEVNNIILGKLRIQFDEGKSATTPNESGLIAFAQRNEVEAFMQGVTNFMMDTIYNEIQDYRKKIADIVENIFKDTLDEDTRKSVIEHFKESESKLSENLDKNIDERMRHDQISKVVDMIQHLPKNELAYMAESLVNLTAFKRKISNTHESVGGPIDVAVISKSEGFVWIKRKHYFPIELNKDYKSR